jgi:hypothetical protein
MSRWEYEWCQVNYGRVTNVNGVWKGHGDPDPEKFSTCPNVWSYLNQRGAEGWEIASSHGYEVVAKDAHDAIQIVVLKRQLK